MDALQTSRNLCGMPTYHNFYCALFWNLVSPTKLTSSRLSLILTRRNETMAVTTELVLATAVGGAFMVCASYSLLNLISPVSWLI